MSEQTLPDQNKAHDFKMGTIHVGITANNPHIGEMTMAVIFARFLESMGAKNIQIETNEPDQFNDSLEKITDQDVENLMAWYNEQNVKLVIRNGIGGRAYELAPKE